MIVKIAYKIIHCNEIKYCKNNDLKLIISDAYLVNHKYICVPIECKIKKRFLSKHLSVCKFYQKLLANKHKICHLYIYV